VGATSVVDRCVGQIGPDLARIVVARGVYADLVSLSPSIITSILQAYARSRPAIVDPACEDALLRLVLDAASRAVTMADRGPQAVTAADVEAIIQGQRAAETAAAAAADAAAAAAAAAPAPDDEDDAEYDTVDESDGAGPADDDGDTGLGDDEGDRTPPDNVTGAVMPPHKHRVGVEKRPEPPGLGFATHLRSSSCALGLCC
jgi:hypothetical protein